MNYLESFKSFSNLNKLYLACNNIKTIRLKHDEFIKLEVNIKRSYLQLVLNLIFSILDS